MESRPQKGRCYICRLRYWPEDLGRMRLPLTYTRFQEAWFRVVCHTCYDAVITAWSDEFHAAPPMFHGF